MMQGSAIMALADATVKGIAVTTTGRSPVADTVRVGVVHTAWNATIIDALVGGVRGELARQGVSDDRVVVQQVPGSFELPFAVRCLLDSGRVDVVVAVGCLIKGGTMHFEYIADATAHVSTARGRGELSLVCVARPSPAGWSCCCAPNRTRHPRLACVTR
jgi:hypothetical protein